MDGHKFWHAKVFTCAGKDPCLSNQPMDRFALRWCLGGFCWFSARIVFRMSSTVDIFAMTED